MTKNTRTVSALAFLALAAGASADTNTQTSPGIGPVPSDFSPMGGIVLDMVGANGKRLTAQVSPTSLAKGYASPTSPFLAVWSQTGFDSYTLQSLLGGGLQTVNIRVTLQNGESGSPNPVYEQIFGAYTMPYSGTGILCPSCLPREIPTRSRNLPAGISMQEPISISPSPW